MALSTNPTHCDLGPDECFACKARFWRLSGNLTISYSQGQDYFHDGCVAADIRETLEVAKRDGRELEYVGGGPSPVPTQSLGVL